MSAGWRHYGCAYTSCPLLGSCPSTRADACAGGEHTLRIQEYSIICPASRHLSTKMQTVEQKLISKKTAEPSARDVELASSEFQWQQRLCGIHGPFHHLLVRHRLEAKKCARLPSALSLCEDTGTRDAGTAKPLSHSDDTSTPFGREAKAALHNFQPEQGANDTRFLRVSR